MATVEHWLAIVSSLAAVGPFAVVEQMATVELEPDAVLTLAVVRPFCCY